MREFRVLAIDPGEKRIGLAISDPTGTIANPLQVIKHTSRIRDAAMISQIASDREVQMIVVGAALNSDDQQTARSRSADRLAAAICSQTSIRVVTWDEYGSTEAVRDALLVMGVRTKRRRGHHDALAATVILQSYLDNELRSK